MTGYVFQAGHHNVPELLVMIAPYMNELIALRKANSDLRFATYKPNTAIDSLLEDTPFSVKQDDDGRWSYSFTLSDDMHTGGSGMATPEEALKTALNHVVTVWQMREREFKERYGIEDED